MKKHKKTPIFVLLTMMNLNQDIGYCNKAKFTGKSNNPEFKRFINLLKDLRKNVKILENDEGLESLKTMEESPFHFSLFVEESREEIFALLKFDFIFKQILSLYDLYLKQIRFLTTGDINKYESKAEILREILEFLFYQVVGREMNKTEMEFIIMYYFDEYNF